MGKYRGLMVVVIILLLILLPTALAIPIQCESQYTQAACQGYGCDWVDNPQLIGRLIVHHYSCSGGEKDVTSSISSDGDFLFERALGVYFGDGGKKDRCGDPVPYPISHTFLFETYTDTTLSNLFMLRKGSEWATWNGLPYGVAQQRGCYFISEEKDDNANDAALVQAPLGKTIGNIPTTAEILFFGKKDDETLRQNSHLGLFPNRDYDAEGNEMDSVSDNHGWCGIRAAQISSSDMYICQRSVSKPEAKVWYICDRNHLTKDTGKYLPYYVPKDTPPNEDDAAAPPTPADALPTNDPAMVGSAPSVLGIGDVKIDPTWGISCTENGVGEYVWEPQEITCEMNPKLCATTKTGCEANGYSWGVQGVTATEEQNACCGDDPDDYGLLNQAGDRICLPVNDNNFAVGSANNIFSEMVSGQTASCVGTTTCWLEAKSSNTAVTNPTSTILTIRASGKLPFDIVSDSQIWRVCDESLGETAITNTETIEQASRASVNGLYCFKEGNHWSWAQCRSPEESPESTGNGLSSIPTSIKTRFAGDNLYSIFLDPSFTNTPRDSYTIKPTDAGLHMTEYYGPNTYFDFSGYTELDLYIQLYLPENEFPATLEQLKTILPLDINIKLYGPSSPGEEPVIYLDQFILGDVVGTPYWNTPLFEGENYKDNYLHIKVPIPNNLEGISQLSITPSSGIYIKIKNINLNKDTLSPICSGFESGKVPTNWLIDFDDANKDLPGERMCTSQFGPNAWLGYDEVKDNDQAHCCGDDGAEYYSGDSAPMGNSENPDPASLSHFGCFNGQPIKHGDSSALIDVVLNYSSIQYIPQDNPILIQTNLGVARGDVNLNLNPFEPTREFFSIEIPSSCIQHYVGKDGLSCHEWNLARMKEVWWQPGYKYSENPNRKETIDYLDGYILEKNSGKRVGTIVSDHGLFTYLLTEEELLESSTGPYNLVYYINTKPEAVSLTNAFTLHAIKERSVFHFSCSSSECLIPLPPTTSNVFNPNPGQYDLYVIRNNGITSFVGNKGLDPFDNYQDLGHAPAGPSSLLVRRVPKQVIFFNPNDADTTLSEADRAKTHGFYSCGQSTEIIDNNNDKVTIQEANRCQVLTNNFCAPSVSNKGKTQINSWDTNPITRLGYKDPTNQADFEDGLDLLTEGFPTKQLDPTLPDLTWGVRDRTTLAKAVPARNILPNSEFKYDSTLTISEQLSDLPYWTIFKDGTPIGPENERQDGEHIFVTSASNVNSITLPPQYTLRSDRVPIEQLESSEKFNLIFSAFSTCKPNLILLKSDGSKSTETEGYNILDALQLAIGQRVEFTKEYIAAYVEFSAENRECRISVPNLQYVYKDQEPAAYTDESELTRSTEPSRSGVSCCPNNGCWNGYACVQEFTQSSFLVEKTGKDNKYRCTKGEWTNEPVKYDWLGKNYGYCPAKTDCFVLSSLKQTEASTIVGLPDKGPIDFYKGFIPMCIPDKTFILDHFCDAGDWTSRTGYVASAMMDIASNEDTYSLFCGLPTQVAGKTIEIGSLEEDAIFGSDAVVIENAPAGGLIGEDTPAGPISVTGCYPQMIAAAGELVQENENTCINKMCVLKKNDGTVYFATSLNPNPEEDIAEDPAVDPNIFNHPFFKAVQVNDPNAVNCGDINDDNYQKCQITGDLIPAEMGIKYSPSLNITIYGPNLAPRGIQAAWGALKTFFTSLFGSNRDADLTEALFLNHSRNIDGVYVFKSPEKNIQAIKERISNGQGSIVINATFDGYTTPICPYTEYIRNIAKDKLPWQAVSGEVLEEADRGQRLKCQVDSGVQRVELTTSAKESNDANSFFGELTAKLRVQE